LVEALADSAGLVPVQSGKAGYPRLSAWGPFRAVRERMGWLHMHTRQSGAACSRARTCCRRR